MTERSVTERKLAGQLVAFTGRLVLMSRRAAVDLVECHGGTVTPTVNRQTSVLVVGREGWPLRSDGRLTRKLQQARRLQREQRTPDLVPEERFFGFLQQGEPGDQVRRTYSVAELTDLLDVSRSRIESWQRNGLIAPVEVCLGVPRFDFRQVAAARSLRALLDGGVSPRRLARSLRELQIWLSDDMPVSELLPALLREGKQFLYRTETGRLVETTGQLVLEFAPDAESTTVPWSNGTSDDANFAEAVRLEQDGQLEEAADRYRQILLQEGPDPDVCFNLANVLHRKGELQAAIERLYEAVTLDPEYADAWNNLGNLLAEKNRLEEACHAYHQAVTIDPEYADSHYGLADVLDQVGRCVEARIHWRTYLQIEPAGECADYARSRLTTQTA
jgi:tetratricopeptide (TPR) repeat protein